jgi:hypothetical protein
MSSLLKIIIFLSGALFTFTVLALLVRRKINERNSLVWLTGAVLIMIISLYPALLDWIARQVGVDYPPSLLFLFSILVLLVIVLYQSIQISMLNEKVKELAQHISINHYEDRRSQQIFNEEIEVIEMEPPGKAANE